MTEKMKTTNGEEGSDVINSVYQTADVDDEIATTSNNVSTGLLAGCHNPPTLGTPNCTSRPATENSTARARMSAVIHLWTGGKNFPARSKSISVANQPNKFSQKSYNSSNTSAISTAATSAATAAAAATAASAPSPETFDNQSAASQLYSNSSTTSECHVLDLSPAIEGNFPPSDQSVPGFPRIPKSSSARFVQLAASIPEHSNESEDGACTGSKFKVMEQKRLVTNSLPGKWREKKALSVDHCDEVKVMSLTERNVAAFNGENTPLMTEVRTSRDNLESFGTAAEHNSTCNDAVRPSRRFWGKQLSVTSSMVTEDSLDEVTTRADVH